MTASSALQLREQVAVALCLWLNGKKHTVPPTVIWAALSEEHRQAYREQAEAAIEACHIEELRMALDEIAAWEQGEVVDSTFDEPCAASTARALLAKLDGKP